MQWKNKYRVVFVHNVCLGVAFFSRKIPVMGKLPKWFDCRYENGTLPNWRDGVQCGNCKQKVIKPYSSAFRIFLGLALDKKNSRRYNREVKSK